MKNKIDKWEKWIDIISKEVVDLYSTKRIFIEIQTIITQNPIINQPNVFYSYLSSTYSTFILAGIRRLTKSNKDSITLVGLLRDLIKQPELLSRERWINNYDDEMSNNEIRNAIILSKAHKEFDCLVGKSNDHIEPSTIKEDIGILENKTKILENFVDKTIAHHDKREKITVPKWSDLNDALDIIDIIFRKYYMLLKCSNLIQSEGEIQGNWKEIFHVPWIQD